MLVSDFLLVQVPGEGWLPFRDVFERDGKQVRDREERLAKLFLDGRRRGRRSTRRGQIMDEGARYNIGNVEPEHQHADAAAAVPDRRCTASGSRSSSASVTMTGTVVEFKETVAAHLIATTGGRDLPVDGRFWMDAATGTILRTELHAVDTSVEAHITVTYRLDDGRRAVGAGADGRAVSARPATPTKCAAWPPTRGSAGSR